MAGMPGPVFFSDNAAPLGIRHPFFHIATLTLLNRAAIFLCAYVAYVGLNGQMVGFFDASRDIWARWDTRHYLNIAENWYQAEGEDRFLIVFYPLYPIAIRLMHFVVNDYFWAAITVSLLALVAATYFLYRLVLLEFNDTEVARDSVKYLLIFPFSFFLSMAYTESLFILLTVLTFYFCRKDQWLLACLAGMLAAMTRNQGILLLLPLAIELVCQYRQRGMPAIELIKRGACLLFVPLGLGAYLSINKWVTGEWFKFLEYQREHWFGTFGFFAENLKNILLNVRAYDAKLVISTWIPEFVLFFVAIYFITAASRKIAPSYIVYSVVYLVISYSPTWLLAGPRYISAMFPLFIFIAIFVRGNVFRQQLIDIAFYLLLGVFIVLFFQANTIV